MIRPTQKDIGRKVIYKGISRQVGVIIYFDERIVYVRFEKQKVETPTFRWDLDFVE